jgi:hypothetical protein
MKVGDGATAWSSLSSLTGGGGGAVASVFGRTGTVTAQTGDYTATQVGALPSTDDLSAIATANVTAANVAMNSHKITGLANGTASSDAAAFGQIPTLPTLPPTPVVALTDAATIVINAALGVDFRVTLAGNRTMGAPSNPTDGQRILFQITQDGTGSRTLTWNAAYEFSSALPSPTLSTAAGATDLAGFIYNATKTKWLFVAFINGFS